MKKNVFFRALLDWGRGRCNLGNASKNFFRGGVPLLLTPIYTQLSLMVQNKEKEIKVKRLHFWQSYYPATQPKWNFFVRTPKGNLSSPFPFNFSLCCFKNFYRLALVRLCNQTLQCRKTDPRSDTFLFCRLNCVIRHGDKTTDGCTPSNVLRAVRHPDRYQGGFWVEIFAIVRRCLSNFYEKYYL